VQGRDQPITTDTSTQIATNRPSFTNSSIVVPSGSLQAENGFLETYNQGQNIVSSLSCTQRECAVVKASLEWSFLYERQIVVPGTRTKSGEPHPIPIVGGAVRFSKFIFHRRDGEPITEFRKSWKTACKKAGCGNMIPYDMRRSAARDMIRALSQKAYRWP
jgi:hypothetical protein